jgi:adenosylhomocysteine nucleosidase
VSLLTAHLGILAGLQSEARCLSAGGGHAWTVALSGTRLDGARRAARQLVEAGATHLLSFGLAGGLDPSLAPGTLLLPERLLTPDGRAIPVEAAWHARATALLADLRPVTAAMAGTDEAVATAAAKAALFARTRATAVDMESHVLAATAPALPLLIVRVVADAAGDALPPAALVGVRPDGSTDLGAVLGSVLRRPGQIPALMRLGRAAATAEARLREVARLGAPTGFAFDPVLIQ